MSFTTLKKKYCLTALILVLLVSALFLFVGVNPKTVNAEKYQTGASVDVGFSFDFSDYNVENLVVTGKATDWHNYVYESDNMRLQPINPAENSIAPGSGTDRYDGVTYNTGYLIYKVEAGGTDNAPKVFGDLSLTCAGRVFHNGHSDKCSCRMEIYISTTDDTSFGKAFKEVLADTGGAQSVYNFDLTEQVKDKTHCFIKILMTGCENEWVSMRSLNISGSSYYKDKVAVDINIVDLGKDILFTKGDVVSLKEVLISGGETADLQAIVSVKDASGNDITLSEDKKSFVAENTGRYVITYTVNDEDRIYTDSYEIFCVEDSSVNGLVSGKYGKYDNTEVVKEENYVVSDGGDISADEETVEIAGVVAYKLPLNLSDKVTVLFSISKFYDDDVFEMAFTSECGLFATGTYDKIGLYYTIKAEKVDNNTKYYIYGSYQNGAEIKSLGKLEISSLTGNHYIQLDPNGSNGITALFDDVDMSVVGDYSVVTLNNFVPENKAYISYSVSKRAKIELSNIINFAEFSGYDKAVIKNTQNYFVDEYSSVSAIDNGTKISGSVAYLLPLDFSSSINFVFDIDKLDIGGKFEFALTAQPGTVDFNFKDDVGLYYEIVKNYHYDLECNSILISGWFKNSEGKLETLGQYRIYESDKYEIFSDHGFGIKKRLDQGIATYFDGIELFSYQNYTYVDVPSLLNNNNVFINFRTVKAEIAITNLVKSDVYNPILVNPENMSSITRKLYPSDGIVGDTFVLPNFKMYDVIDGFVPFNIEVMDSNGNEVDVYTNANGKTCFDVVYEGLYTISYISVDYTGNAIKDNRNVTMSLKDGAPVMKFKASAKLDTFGRQGRAIELNAPTVTVNGERNEELENSIIIKIYHPSGSYIERKVNTTFTPFDLGIYTIIYEVKNEVATTYAYFEVNVKMDVDPEDSYNSIMDSENWVTASDNVMEETDDGLLIYGEKAADKTAYCKLPFEMTNGIEITLDLTGLANKKEIDNWVSVGIGSAPKYGHFANLQSGYIYFMLYFEGGTYFVNAQYMSRDGDVNGLFGPIEMGDSGIVTLSLEKLLGSTSRTDHVNIYLNHQKTAYGTEDLVTYSHLVDDENFTYISIHNYGLGTDELTAKDFKAAKITEITVCDQEAPQFNVAGEIVKEAKIGSTVTIPSIEVTDNLDPNFVYSIMLVDPNGREISVDNGSFVAEMYGTYYLVFRSYDKSGNYNTIINEIVINDGRGCSSGFDLNGMLPVLTVLPIGAILLCVRKFKRKNKQ